MMKFWSLAIKLNELESESDKMKGEVDSLVNIPIATSLKTIAHSALWMDGWMRTSVRGRRLSKCDF